MSVSDRLVLRKLFQALGLSCKSGEEAARAGEFLTGLIALAKAAGGDAPLPAAPAVTEIEDIQRLIGNEQLVAIKDKATEWEDKIKGVGGNARSDRERASRPGVSSNALQDTLAAIPEAKPQLDQIDAIRSQRLLLEAADPANTVRQALAGLLRDAVQKGHAAHEAAFAAANAALAANGIWAKLKPPDQDSIKSAVGLTAPSKPDVATDEALADTLDRKPLAGIQAEIDAIAGRVNQAIERAARLLEPKVQTVTLERSTLRDRLRSKPGSSGRRRCCCRRSPPALCW